MFSASFACNVVSAPKQRVLTNPKILIAQIPITGISDIGRPPLLFIKIDNDTPICLFAIVLHIHQIQARACSAMVDIIE